METKAKPDADFLEGRLLVAMPGMGDPRFAQSLIYLCAHSDEGAMGLIINKKADDLSFPELLKQLNIEPGDSANAISVHVGGPVEMGRGFVLHSKDFRVEDATTEVEGGICLTATIDILRAMATGTGPRRSLIALGYAGWAPGQLEGEIQQNGWLFCPADEDLVFGEDDDEKWVRAMKKIGVDPAKLSGAGGHA
jgi:putative transcriptional regulator